MTSKKTILTETASQTAGPYVHIGCTPNFSGMNGVYNEDLGNNLKREPVEGREIFIKGIVFDGNGEPLLDAMVEIWQADARGFYNSNQEVDSKTSTNFTGWGRCASDMQTGEFEFATIKPGLVPYNNGGLQAPHITFWIVARGINIGLHTRMYFSDEGAANQTDPLLLSIKDRNRISTLFAHPKTDGVYQFDIHLQGPKETIFLDI